MLINTLIALNLMLAPTEISLEDIQHFEQTTSEVTRIYLIRHGESTINQLSSTGIKLTSGKSHAIPLTENGKKQATEVAIKLIGKFPEDGQYIILSSTALRAQETADRIFDVLKNHYFIERKESIENLCELGHGSWEGKPKDKLFDDAAKFWENLSAKDKFVSPKFTTSESPKDVADRMLSGIKQIIEDNPNKTILLTTHYFAMNSLVLQLSGHVDDLSEVPSTQLPSLDIGNCDLLLIELPIGNTIEQAKIQAHIKSEEK